VVLEAVTDPDVRSVPLSHVRPEQSKVLGSALEGGDSGAGVRGDANTPEAFREDRAVPAAGRPVLRSGRRHRAEEVPKTVILDIDGTLMDTNYLHVKAWAHALEEVRDPVPRAVIHEQIGKGSDKLIPEFVEGEEASEKASELHKKFYAEIQDRAHPLPGAKELISSLSERGYEVWFATSAEPEELEHHMGVLEAEGKIAGVVSSGDAEESKPSPDIFELAVERAGSPREEAVVVGDSVWDIEAAKEAGVRAVAVLTGGAFSRAELEEAGAYAVYKDCAELLEAGFPEELDPSALKQAAE
jgi:HAD superfamily hydrolase (TIGR01509 family)